MGSGLDLGTIYASIEIRHAGIRAAVDEVKNQLRDLSRTTDAELKKVNDALTLQKSVDQIGSKLSKFVTLPLLAAGGAGLKFAASLETQQLAFGTLLGSMEKGKALYQELVELAAKTPLQLPDVTKAAQSLIAYGASAKDVGSIITMLGDLAMGDAGKLNGILLQYGQAMAAGVVHQQDLNAMINNGVPIVEAIADQMGIAQSSVRKMVEESQVSFRTLDAAMRSLVAEGGKFHGMMRTIGEESASGKLSTAIDNLRIAAASMMQDLVPVLKEVAENVSVISGKFSELSDGSRRALLSVIGIVAAIGPITSVTSALMKMGTAIKVVTSTPLGLGLTAGVAAIAALAVVVQKVKNADRDLLSTDEKLANETRKRADEAARLTKTYTDLAGKTQKTKEEQAQLAETAKTLKELFPELTAVYDENTGAITLNTDELKRNAEAQEKAAIAAIQKQIADTSRLMYAKKEAIDQADARSSESEQRRLQAINDYVEAARKAGLAGIDKDSAVASIEEQGKSYKNLSAGVIRIIETYKAANEELYKNSKNAKNLRDEYDELTKAFNKLYDARYKVETGGTPEAPSTPTAAGTVEDKSQGARLKALDLFYRARVDAAAKGSAEEEAILHEYNDKRQDLLWSFVEEDVKNGKTASQSLESAFKDVGMSYKTLGQEIAVGLNGTKYAYSDFTLSVMANIQRLANMKGVTIETLIGDPARTAQVTEAMGRALVAVKQRMDALMAAGGDQGELQKALEPLQALYASLSENLKSPFTLMLENYETLKRDLEDARRLLGELNDEMTKAIFAGDADSENKYRVLIERQRERIKQLEVELKGYADDARSNRDRARGSGDLRAIVSASKIYISELEREQALLAQGSVAWQEKTNEIKKAKSELSADIASQLDKATEWVSITNNIASAMKDGIQNGFDLANVSSMADDLGAVVGAAIPGVGAEVGKAVGGLVGAIGGLFSTLFSKESNFDVDEFLDSMIDHKELARAAVDKVVSAFNEGLPDAVKDASSSLVDSITQGFVDGDWDNFGDTLNEQLRAIVVQKVLAAGLFADEVQTLLEEAFAGSTKSGRQQIKEKTALRDELQGNRDDLKNEYDQYVALKAKLADLEDDLDDMSGAEKFFTNHNEALEADIDAVEARLRELEGDYEAYLAFGDQIAALNAEIAAIDPLAEADFTVDTLSIEKIKELVDTYGSEITGLLEEMGLWTAEAVGAAKELGDDAVASLMDGLMEAAWNADYSSFEKALGERLKAAVISATLESVGIQTQVQALVDQMIQLSEGGYTASELASIRAAGQSLYSSTQAILSSISGVVDAAFGLANSTVTVQSEGNVITMMSGGDRDYLAEAFRQAIAELQPIITLTSASIAQIQCTDLIVQSLTYVNNGDFHIGTINATDFESFLKSTIAKMIAEA